MSKYRIMVNKSGTVYRIQRRVLGCLWWEYVTGYWLESPLEFNTPEDAQDMINKWKLIDDKYTWRVYHYD